MNRIELIIEVAPRSRTCRSCGFEIPAGNRYMVAVIGRRRISICFLCVFVAHKGVRDGRP